MTEAEVKKIIEEAAASGRPELDLRVQGLTTLPPEIARLTKLRLLYLDGNRLTSLPPEIARLANLQVLTLSGNQLTALPAEMGALTKLGLLSVKGNPLRFPPPDIVRQGAKAILEFLRSHREAATRVWRSKLLLVGQGGVGKTCLLRALRGEPFEQQPSTHGIGIHALPLDHPRERGATMELNAWDFGGQEIYHATHQFFLSNRSLFLLVWNARQEWEQGRLYYWLDNIQARAPESPVMIVASQIDERRADLPLEDIQRRYPQVRGQWAVSNLTGEGIAELREAIRDVAAGLPLMGEKWPTSWLRAAEAIRAHPKREKVVSPSKLREVMAAKGVTGEKQDILARWLHELGEILYFQDNRELSDIVILKPEWVTGVISRVLDSRKIEQGVLTRPLMVELWNDIDAGLREHFLRFMEQFDLSYRTPDEGGDIAIVVERLALDPPDYQADWASIQERPGTKEISMDFELGSTLPAGIPTWFIARSHRFTTGTHWRYGALFADGEKREHLALVQAFPHDRLVRLAAWGPVPHNLFTLLKDGFELTLGRFPGLKFTRRIPCPGHNGEPCEYKFDYDLTRKLIERERPLEEVQCQRTGEMVSLAGLLFGIHWRTENRVLERIDQLESRLGTEFRELRELLQRQFLNVFRALQESVDTCCPNVFVLRPHRPGALQTLAGEQGQTLWQEIKSAELWKKYAGEELELHLFCQAPGKWHVADDGGRYVIGKPAEWLRELAPYVKKMLGVLKYAVPIAGAAAGAALAENYEKSFKRHVEFMKTVVEKLPEPKEPGEFAGSYRDPLRAEGAELRALRRLLDARDPKQKWGGLQRVATPEGHYLWLCKYHVAEYQ